MIIGWKSWLAVGFALGVIFTISSLFFTGTLENLVRPRQVIDCTWEHWENRPVVDERDPRSAAVAQCVQFTISTGENVPDACNQFRFGDYKDITSGIENELDLAVNIWAYLDRAWGALMCVYADPTFNGDMVDWLGEAFRAQAILVNMLEGNDDNE